MIYMCNSRWAALCIQGQCPIQAVWGLGQAEVVSIMFQALGEPHLRGAANDVYRDTSIIKGVEDPQVGQPS